MSEKSKRTFLLYSPVNKMDLVADVFGEEREYDIALHDFGGDIYSGHPDAEYKFSGRGHKWACIQDNIPLIEREYQYYAFIDNDIEITTSQVNRLFRICVKNRTQLHQPTLTARSHCSHSWLYKRRFSRTDIRIVPFVELMMPFFHREALLKCLHTFRESESGWGLDLLWAKILEGNTTVSDSVSVVHSKPLESGSWVLACGKTAIQELEEIKVRHELDTPARRELTIRERVINRLLRWLRRFSIR